ncbi:hypothetical protein FKG94_11705 [Exilibacterium tricleocarpae]|uniref:Peptidase C58 YopT-type domain-containing protein n=1 Tax=Exilibacterium tricleocarpae TaxID=2591008 RepID=A0A545TND0_9GAMM|nr:hypothetical protein [Exilibacterium tricleocarpae]TQV78688.1 hypothetical protein FKG94_11705 [Exilibacterium tricleocarpae]
MHNGFNLYGGKYIFKRSVNYTRVTGFNASPAPGFAGEGMDADVCRQIGYLDGTFSIDGVGFIPGRDHVAGTRKKRMQGVCCGISTAWMAAFLGGNADATNHGSFGDFFQVMRFQGAYGKFYGDRPWHQETLLNSFGLGPLTATQMTFSQSANIPFQRFALRSRWVGYVFTCEHVIAIGKARDSNFFIMDPNAGLFEYTRQDQFRADLGEYLAAIWSETHDVFTAPSMDIYFYHKAFDLI